ncbi:MAG: tRNA (adenosine(37)-N6)-threonylcarbamoyltransferase complex dimerization subunit type 1 TsaB [Blautia sp.]|nr:tRNA (adenosine(37)-N6)-threonylcarbamoyltransferase complex dimerization subunit type 1 TsaB [Blautia sp.]
MKILGIDSSGLVASVAIWEDGVLRGEYTVNYAKTHSQTLLPMLDALAKLTELDLASLDAVAVAAGPGSFTGLRIGSATAKGLCQALDKPIVEVPTVDALAYNMAGASGLVCPLMDARRNQVYTGVYSFEGAKLHTVREQEAMGVEELIEYLNALGETVAFLGDGVPVHKKTLEEKVLVPHYYAPAHMALQRAGAVASLGAILFSEGKAVDAAAHVPTYLRMSQAERERKERLLKEGKEA